MRVLPSPAYHPSLNEVEERVNRSLANKYLPILATSKLPDRFWGEAVRVACALRNCSPTSTFRNKETPYERWYGRVPDMSHSKVFGCVAWAHLPSEARGGKTDTHSIKCINLGWFEEHRQYRLFDPITKRIALSRDVKFDETSRIQIDADLYKSAPEYRTNLPQSAPIVSMLDKSSLARQGNREALRAFLTLTDIPDSLPVEEQDAIDAIGNSRSETFSDPCLYVHVATNSVMAVHVDDVLLLVRSSSSGIKEGIMSLFKCKDLGLCKSYLGCNVEQIDGKIKFHCGSAIKDLLVRYGLKSCNILATPMEDRLSKANCPEIGSHEHKEMSSKPYRQVVGSISWIMLACRPDLAYVVNSLAKVQSNPGIVHYNAAKRVLRYLAGTQTLGIVFHNRAGRTITAFADADWAGDRDSRRSTTGYLFMLSGAPISWNCRLQPTIALSSTEAEYMVIGDSVREAIWLNRVYNEICHPSVIQPATLQVKNDNKGAVEVSKNATSHSRTKHIDIRHHFIRDHVEKKTIIISHVCTRDMLADILTKPLSREIFTGLRSKIGMA